MGWFTAVILSLLLASTKSFAVAPRDYTFQDSPASAELSQQSIHTIFQDSLGTLWILTKEGPNRYDGYTVTRFRSSNLDQTSLSHQYTTGIVEDSNGDLWIATKGGLNKFDSASRKFSVIKATPSISSTALLSDDIYSIYYASDDTIWLGYANGVGFSNFNPKSGEFVHFPPSSRKGPTRFVSFTELPNGTIWAAVDNLGLVRVDTNSKSISEIEIKTSLPNSSPALKPTHIMRDSKKKLWISTQDAGLFSYDPLRKSFEQYTYDPGDSSSLSSTTVYMSIEDNVGNIWAATDSGLNVLDPLTSDFNRINTQNSNLPDDHVYSIYQGRSGIIWLGTYNGLVYGRESVFQRVDAANSGLASNSVNAFTQTKDGAIWVGTSNGISGFQPGSNSAIDPKTSHGIILCFQTRQ